MGSRTSLKREARTVKPIMVLTAFLFVALPCWGQAANAFLTPTGSATGNCTGSPIFTPALFNTASNWGTGKSQIGASATLGTTVLICGNFVGAAHGSLLTVQGNGNSTHPITLKFDTGAVMQAPYWGWGSGAISTNGHEFIVIDGNGRAGTIENTSNGTPGSALCLSGSCAFQQPSTLIQLGGNTTASNANITIKNLNLIDVYMRARNDAWPGCPTSCMNNTQINAVYVGGDGTAGPVTITGNLIHDVAWAINSTGNGCAGGCNIYRNEIYNFDHGYAGGLNSNANDYMSGVSFHDNHVHDPANWDDPNNENHHDGVHLYANFGNGTMTATNIQIYGNLFDGNWGNHFTAQLFCQFTAATASSSGVVVARNVFWMANAPAAGNGLSTCVTKGAGTAYYNNTFVCNPDVAIHMYALSPQSAAAAPNNAQDVENNVFVNCPVPIANNRSTPWSVGHWDHNTAENVNKGWQIGSTFYTTLAAWQAACGCDLTGSQANYKPNGVDVTVADNLVVPYVGQPSVTSIVKGTGMNLSSLRLPFLDNGTTLGGLIASVLRGTTWDQGAFVVGAAAQSLPTIPTFRLGISTQ